MFTLWQIARGPDVKDIWWMINMSATYTEREFTLDNKIEMAVLGTRQKDNVAE